MTAEQMIDEVVGVGCSVEIYPLRGSLRRGVKIWTGYETYYGRGDTFENAVLGAYIDWKKAKESEAE